MKIKLVILIVLLVSCSEFSTPVSAQVSGVKPEELVLVRAEATEPTTPVDYGAMVSDNEERRLMVAKTWMNTNQDRQDIERELLVSFGKLTDQWIGTRWALGVPQAKTPGKGKKINCGTFVGRVLNDAGFRVKVTHLQRQPAQLIIQSFVGGKRVRKFSNRKMKTFIDSVKEMGPGLYIIGLDFHVGFLLQTETDLRFIHASYENGLVRNESAAIAMPIVTSKYRVVGKILSRANIVDWVKGRKIKVKGKW